MWPFKRMVGSCPDDKHCRRLARTRLVFGFMCVGKLDEPTDHVLPGVNDLCFCFRQGCHVDRYHFNRTDVRVLNGLMSRAMKRLEDEGDALHHGE